MKRETASLAPFCERDGAFSFFLQKRGASMRRYPNRFGMFGGGLEGAETPREGLLREIREELAFDASAAEYFSRYEFSESIEHAHWLRVAPDFAEQVTVLEGEYGQFFSLDDARADARVMLTTKLVLTQMADRLRANASGV